MLMSPAQRYWRGALGGVEHVVRVAEPVAVAIDAFTELQVDGMNCIGPTARSYIVSPSSVPPSESRISATFGRPSSGMPRIRFVAVPVLAQPGAAESPVVRLDAADRGQ